MIQVRRFEPQNRRRLRVERGAILIAAAPRIFYIIQQRKSAYLKHPRDLLLLLLTRHRRNRRRKILRSVIFVPALLDGNSDRVHLRIQNVGAVRRRIHPRDVQRGNVRSFRNILRNQAETCAGQAQPRLQIGFAIEAMRKRIVIGEEGGVQARGVGQRSVPLQLMQTQSGAFVVDGVVEHLFGGIGRTRGGRGERSGDETQYEDGREREAHENVKNGMAKGSAHVLY